MEAVAATSLGTALFESFSKDDDDASTAASVVVTVDGISGRDFALVVTLSRCSGGDEDGLTERAMKVATAIVLAGDDQLKIVAGSSSSHPSGLFLRRRLLWEAMCLPGMERSAGSMLELAEEWLISRRSHLSALGVEAIATVFATQPHARDEVLSTALAAMAESNSSMRLRSSMLMVLERLTSAHRSAMRDHLGRIQSWMDYLVELPLPIARRVLTILIPFVAISPSFANYLLVRLQKLITSRVASRRSLAVFGLTEIIKHLPENHRQRRRKQNAPAAAAAKAANAAVVVLDDDDHDNDHHHDFDDDNGGESDIDSVLEALRVALRRASIALRAEIYSSIDRALDYIDPGFYDRFRTTNAALTATTDGRTDSPWKSLRNDLLTRLRSCLTDDGILDLDRLLVDVCGQWRLREPFPELFGCVVRLEGTMPVRRIVEGTLLRPLETIRTAINYEAVRSSIAMTLLMDLTAMALNVRVGKTKEEEDKILQLYGGLREVVWSVEERRRREHRPSSSATMATKEAGEGRSIDPSPYKRARSTRERASAMAEAISNGRDDIDGSVETTSMTTSITADGGSVPGLTLATAISLVDVVNSNGSGDAAKQKESVSVALLDAILRNLRLRDDESGGGDGGDRKDYQAANRDENVKLLEISVHFLLMTSASTSPVEAVTSQRRSGRRSLRSSGCDAKNGDGSGRGAGTIKNLYTDVLAVASEQPDALRTSSTLRRFALDLFGCSVDRLSCTDENNGGGDTTDHDEGRIQATLKPLVELLSGSKWYLSTTTSTIDVLTMSLAVGFLTDFQSAMTTQLATTYLHQMYRNLQRASDDVLRQVSEILLTILEEYVISQPSVLRGILLNIYNCLEIDDALILARSILTDCREAAAGDDDDDGGGKHRFSNMDEELLREGRRWDGEFLSNNPDARTNSRESGDGDENGGDDNDERRIEWSIRAKKLCLSHDEKCRICSLNTTVSFLTEYASPLFILSNSVHISFRFHALHTNACPSQEHPTQKKKHPISPSLSTPARVLTVTSREGSLDASIIGAIAECLDKLLLERKQFVRVQIGHRRRRQPVGKLPFATASHAVGIASVLLRIARAECLKALHVLTRRKHTTGSYDADDVAASLEIVYIIVKMFYLRR